MNVRDLVIVVLLACMAYQYFDAAALRDEMDLDRVKCQDFSEKNRLLLEDLKRNKVEMLEKTSRLAREIQKKQADTDSVVLALLPEKHREMITILGMPTSEATQLVKMAVEVSGLSDREAWSVVKKNYPSWHRMYPSKPWEGLIPRTRPSSE